MSGGFDCILGNPPWEMVQLDPGEYFAVTRPEISALPNMAAKERAIAKLKSSAPEEYQKFFAANQRVHAEQVFYHGSGRYPLTSRGRLNLAPLFAEAVRDLVDADGRSGVLVPSGIATDSFTQHFFRDLVERASLVSLFDFENREALFEAVDSRMKFSCLTLRAPASDAASAVAAPPAEFVFFAQRVEQLDEPERRFTLSAADFALVNPNTRTCPIFRSRTDAELTKFIYRRVPVLVKEATETEPEVNPWGFNGLLMFMMNTASSLFRTREQLEGDGWKLRGNVFERGPEKYLPLYEAKMVHHFDHRWATYDGLETRDVTDAERADPSFAALPRYWVGAPEVDAKLAGRWDHPWLLGWRDITNTTNERTVIAGVTAPSGCGDTWLLGLPRAPSLAARAQWVAVLNSLGCDFIARQKIGGTHLKFHTFKQLAVLTPDRFTQPACGATWLDWLTPRVLELSATADDMAPFSRDLWPTGDGAVFRYDPARRFEIRCELDVAFFHLYLGTPADWAASASPELLRALPTPRHAVDYIMNTFPIVKRKDEEAHGCYRTRDRILALYDPLQECLAAGKPFTSSLTPPPGPPTNPDGSFAALPAWRKGAPQPSTWPAHIHPPLAHRS